MTSGLLSLTAPARRTAAEGRRWRDADGWLLVAERSAHGDDVSVDRRARYSEAGGDCFVSPALMAEHDVRTDPSSGELGDGAVVKVVQRGSFHRELGATSRNRCLF